MYTIHFKTKFSDDLSSKIYKSMETLQNRLVKFPQSIETISPLMKSTFTSHLLTKNKNIIDYTMNWLISLYLKLDSSDRDHTLLCSSIVLNIFFENIMNEKFPISMQNHKCCLCPDENFYFNSQKNKQKFLDSMGRIYYIQECLDKRASNGHYTMKISQIIEMEFSYFGKYLIATYLNSMINKIKSNLNKFDIEAEKFFLQLIFSHFRASDAYYYLFDIICSPFDASININHRKLFLFAVFVLIKICGGENMCQFMKIFCEKLVKTPKDMRSFFFAQDFQILYEYGPFNAFSIDTTKGFLNAFQNVICDTINNQHAELNVGSRLDCLRNFIYLMEALIEFIKFSSNNNHITSIYSFYYSIQMKLIQSFSPFQDKHTKSLLDQLINSPELSQVLREYEENYAFNHKCLSDILAFLNGNHSLIFHNWLILIYTCWSSLDSFFAVRTFVITKKEGGMIYTLLKLNYDIYKFYPELWKLVLESFLTDANRNQDENFNFISNLKFIFYYEMSLSIGYPQLKSQFYDSLSYDSNVIVKFFRQKFPILSSTFYSKEIPILQKSDLDDYLRESLSREEAKKEKDGQMVVEIEEQRNSMMMKIKVEILNILCFIISTYKDEEIVSSHIIKFVLNIFDTFVQGNEPKIVLEHIKQVITLLIKNYSKSCSNNKFLSSPFKAFFSYLMKHMAHKVLKNKNEAYSKIYYQYFIEIYHHLLSKPNSLIDFKNAIIYTVKQMIYKNVDNQSFKNPIAIKNMQGLNDIDEMIVYNDYILDVLELLDKEDQISFYGFYMRFLKYSIRVVKCQEQNTKNLKKLLRLLMKMKWIPEHYSQLIEVFFHEHFKDKEKFLEHIYNFMLEYLPNFTINDKRMSLYQIQLKIIIFDNIKLLVK